MVSDSYEEYIKNLSEDILNYAKKIGIPFVELYFEDNEVQNVSLAQSEIELASFGHFCGAGIRVISGNRVGYAHSALINKKSLIETLVAASKIMNSDRSVTNILLETNSVDPSRLVPYDLESQSLSEFKEVLNLVDYEARSYSKQVVEVLASFETSRKSVYIINSDNSLVSDLIYRTKLVTRAVARGDSGLQTGYEVLAKPVKSREFLKFDLRTLAQESARVATLKLNAEPAPRGENTVVLAKGSGGILFHEACGHSLEADHINKGISQFKDLIGTQVADPQVNLVDDPSAEGQWGSLKFDDEGNPARETVLIENGVLVNYMYDRLRAKEKNIENFCNCRRESYRHVPMVRMTNTFIKPGNYDPDEIIESTDDGIYVKKLSGGQVNTTTGDFVFGYSEAYKIKNGRLVAPLREANLIGNGKAILKGIEAVANDFDMSPGTCGKDGQQVPVGCGQPTLRINKMTIGGTTK